MFELFNCSTSFIAKYIWLLKDLSSKKKKRIRSINWMMIYEVTGLVMVKKKILFEEMKIAIS